MNITDSPVLADFKWTPKRVQAAFALAEGLLVNEVAAEVGVSLRTLYRWRHDIQFSDEVDRLSLMLGIALKAERVRIAKRAVRQMVREELDPATGRTKSVVDTDRDLLDWLKYVQSETDGIKLNLTNLLYAFSNSTDHDAGSDKLGDLPGNNSPSANKW